MLSFGVEVNAGAPEVKPMGGATRSGDRADSSATGSAVMSPDVEGFFPTSSVELSSVDGKTLYANCDERRGINMHNNVDYKITRGSIIESENDFYPSFALYGYVYDSNQTWPNDGSVDDNINGIEMTKGSDDIWKASSVYWPGASKKATFFAVAPKDCSGASITATSDGPQITYTVPKDVSSQEDLLIAKTEDDVTCDGKHAPSLTFNHALAAIKFEVGEVPEGFSISNVEISGVYNKGELSSFDNLEWTNQSIDGTVANTYTISDLSNVLFLMPQIFTDDAEIKVTFSNGSNSQEFTAKLKEGNNTSWEAGHQYTYSLSANKVTGTFKFEVSQSPENVSTSGGDVTYTVKSVFDYSTGGTRKIPWQATYSLDGSTTTPISGNGGDPSTEELTDATFTIRVPETRTHKEELKNSDVKGTSDAPFDLSTEYNGKVNTANCYVITSPGVYKLPLVYGNAVKDGAYNDKAYKSLTFVDHNGSHIAQPYIYQTSYAPAKATLLWQDAPNLVTKCSLINNNTYLKFEVSKENIDQGNAVIAVQNSIGTTLWSWHIWVTDHDLSSTIAVKNKTDHTAYFMPVPLGWCDLSGSKASKEYTVNFSQTTSGSTLNKTISQVASLTGNAPFYQWGRKDPVVGSTGGSDIKTKTWYDGSGNTKTDTNPLTSTTRSKAESIQHPEMFISGSFDNYTWDDDDPVTYDNWNANVTGQPTSPFNDNAVEKTVYDPSPVGFKMPTTNAFTGFEISEGEGTVNCEGTLDSGYKFKTGLSSPDPTSIYFRANGYRVSDAGGLGPVTSEGCYWVSGSQSKKWGCCLFFLEEIVNPKYGMGRADGASVRPVSEQ